MSLLIQGATILDAVSVSPVQGQAILIEGRRIKAIGPIGELQIPPGTEPIDAAGQFVIPGLMDANVHLLLDMRLENLVRYENRYEELILEAAQVALRNGVTTVFDTWGPRTHLIAVRDRISAGAVPGSRIFCAGNIIGLDGPFSEDFLVRTAEVASGALVARTNALWAENVGSPLTWMTPQQLAQEVRTYTAKGMDFIKYASSEHRIPTGASAFLAFSPACQVAIVEEAHRAGLTAQAHSSSVEALRVAIEAGSDIIQHANSTGTVPIPEDTLELMRRKNVAATIFPITRKRYEWIRRRGDLLCERLFPIAKVETNVRNLIHCGAPLLLATDAGLVASEVASDPTFASVYGGEENLFQLGEGHFNWLKAMEEQGMAPMAMLKAATRNIAVAYRKDKDLGTLEPGKLADLLILDADPLQCAANYRSIRTVIKEGTIVERAALPLQPILSRVTASAVAAALTSSARAGIGGLPGCCG